MNTPKQRKYYIRDCFDKVVGDPLGYLTYIEASTAQSAEDSPVMSEMWIAYEKKQLKDSNWVRIGSIRLG